MKTHHEIVIDEAFRAFTLEQRRAEVGLDLEPGVAQLVALAREVAFRSGWGAAQRWQEGLDAAASTVRASVASTVHALVDLGDRAWVQPLAIIEHIPSGALFVDPLFTLAASPTERCCVELRVTAAGLVATGPARSHRLCPVIDRERLRPLARFEHPPSR